MLGDPKFKESVMDSVASFEQMTTDLRETALVLRRTAEKVEVDLDRIAQSLDSGLTDANAGINEIRQRLVPALDQLSELMVNLNHVSQQLATGGGSAGLFLRDARLYEALVLAVQRITDAVDTVRRIAERFEDQGYIEFQSHDVLGPADYRGKRKIPDAGN